MIQTRQITIENRNNSISKSTFRLIETIIIIINSYSLWHRLKTIYAKDVICITERKILKRKKKSFTSIQSLSLFSDDVASSKCRVNDVFELFICCRFQYQKLKIVCVTDQANEMLNVLIEIFFNQWKLS
jgi:hypothetical protein